MKPYDTLHVINYYMYSGIAESNGLYDESELITIWMSILHIKVC